MKLRPLQQSICERRADSVCCKIPPHNFVEAVINELECALGSPNGYCRTKFAIRWHQTLKRDNAFSFHDTGQVMEEVVKASNAQTR